MPHPPRKTEYIRRTSDRRVNSNSFSYQSDESSIFNALRISSSTNDNDNDRTQAQGHDPDPMLDESESQHLYAIIVMPLSSDPEIMPRSTRTLRLGRRAYAVSEDQTSSTQTQTRTHRASCLMTNNKCFSPSSTNSTGNTSRKLEEFIRLQRRRALSQNDVDNYLRQLICNWSKHTTTATTMSPVVRPLLPSHPPFVRSPTPPGLPTYGTKEAIYLASQFLVPPSRQDIRARRRADTHMHMGMKKQHSYMHRLSRLFGLSDSSSSTTTPPLSNESAVRGIGKADDGSIVQGFFPYRNSGHGINLRRRLDDHPFHNIGLPIADSELSSVSVAEKSWRRRWREDDRGLVGRTRQLQADDDSQGTALFNNSRNSGILSRVQPQSSTFSVTSPSPSLGHGGRSGVVFRDNDSYAYTHRFEQMSPLLSQGQQQQQQSCESDDASATPTLTTQGSFWTRSWCVTVRAYICCCLGERRRS